jgi:lysozyme
LSVIDPQPGERCVIDYEESGCTLTALRDSVQALLDYKRDLQITVYSGHLLKEQLGDDHDDFLAKHTDLWLAQYTSDEANISWPSGTYPQWSLWQYSESGTIPGIDGCYVDLDNFNGNEAAFLKWIAPASVAPPPPPPEPSEVVSVAIDAPDDIGVRVTVNGSSVGRHRLQRLLRAVKRGPDIER